MSIHALFKLVAGVRRLDPLQGNAEITPDMQVGRCSAGRSAAVGKRARVLAAESGWIKRHSGLGGQPAATHRTIRPVPLREPRVRMGAGRTRRLGEELEQARPTCNPNCPQPASACPVPRTTRAHPPAAIAVSATPPLTSFESRDAIDPKVFGVSSCSERETVCETE